jgi:chaperonin GroEL
MKKISIVGIEARNKIIKGADYVADAVKSTLGPYGLNALLEKGNRPTNDGYTISSEIAPTLENEFERRGALALHEASSKTNDEVGDATSTAEALAQAIMKEAIKLLPNEKSLIAKKKPSEILKMIEDSKNNVIEQLKKSKTLITNEEELIAAAKVSVEDDVLAKIIGQAQWKIGKYGFITTEEVNDPTSSIQIVKGIRIDNGFGTPMVVTNPAEQSLELNDASVLLTNYTIGKEELVKFRVIFNELVLQKKINLILIARAFTSEAIQLCMDSMKAGFAVYPINAPYVYQGEIMRDLAAITGATYYDNEETRIDDLTIKDIGFCTKLVARRFDAIITGVENNPLIADSIQQRIKQLEEKLNGNAVSDFEKKGIQARIAQFTGGFAILKVGSETPFQRKYLKDKADDAVNTVRLALQEGTVKGGGLAFKEISDMLADDDILKRPLLCIYNQIMSSAPDGFVIEDWVRDSYLTLVSALKNACSVAGQFCSINVVITTEDKKPKGDDDE